MNEEKRLKRYYGEGGWRREDGVRALEEWREKTYIFKKPADLKGISGAAIKQVAKMIETALQKSYIYNPFCGRLIEDIKGGDMKSSCERCLFLNTCFDVEGIKAEAMTN